jgi:hypothetical protein
VVWRKLVDWTGGALRRGAVLRLPAHYPYERIVDFLVYDPIDRDRGLGLMVDSGYKAGLTLVVLPKESAGAYNGSCICPVWLAGNWSTWVYPETLVENVFISSRRPVPRLPQQEARNKKIG